jgi:uncharacterized cupin superfamily protein
MSSHEPHRLRVSPNKMKKQALPILIDNKGLQPLVIPNFLRSENYMIHSMIIEVKKLSEAELKKINVFDWPIWTKEASEFDWYYDDKESCYILEGEVEVTANDQKVSFKKGDFVIFPKGLSCRWKIIMDVKKHYNFG